LDDAFKNKKSHGIKRSTSLILAAIQRVYKPDSKSEFAEWFKDIIQAEIKEKEVSNTL